MKLSTKILWTILSLGLIYSFFRLFSGHGGSGLYDFFDAAIYSSLILFIASLTILLFNIRTLGKHKDTLVFLFLGLPLTISATRDQIRYINYNKKPHLKAEYPSPVNQTQFKTDSIGIKVALDTFVLFINREKGRGEISSAYIDTIIYSQQGDKIFVPFVMKYVANDRGKNLVTSAFYADKRYPTFWNLREAPYRYSGDFRDSVYLKKSLRKFYFNQFKFADKDSLEENYFWTKMTEEIETIIVD
jgi:hypothetical protein